MCSKYTVVAAFLFCYVVGIRNDDVSRKFTLKLSKYSVVNLQLTHKWKRDTQSEKHGDETMSFALKINNRKHLIHLQKNRDFLHPNFAQYSHNSTGNHRLSSQKSPRHCYYHGEVQGYQNSVVALSTCAGLRGVIILDNETYVLEPVPQSATNDHLLYRLKDVQSEPFTCGVNNEDASSAHSHDLFHTDLTMTSLLRRKRNLPRTSYVELVLVVDNLRYNFKKQNETAVREEAVELANLLDGYYKMLNIRVMLTGLVIFKDGNPFSIEGSAGEVLGRFVKWRKASLLPTMRHDIGQLIVGKPESYGGVLGMAFVGTVCSVSTSGGISVVLQLCVPTLDTTAVKLVKLEPIVRRHEVPHCFYNIPFTPKFSDNSLPYFSTVVAHEMGHNLGMNHDDSRCTSGSYIMGSTASGSTKFSSCSAGDFEALVIRGGGVCLRNQPSASDVIGIAECGNSRLEKGEECDCGKPEECNNKCCDAATCKLTSGSACAQGECCDNCQLRVAGTPCRESVNTCDLPEYCHGTSEFCPNDYYLMDGLPCGDAYCYEGRCQTYDFQCRHLFAPDPATKADDVCFRHANTRGNLFGNCGINGAGQPIKCSVENAMCGKVQCTNVDLTSIPPGAHVSIQIVEGFTCINADFNLGTDVLDPAYVNPGSPCDKGKTCIDFQCVNASALRPNLDCDAQTTCNGNGVCNNEGNCHCENGWGPPYCDQPGRGGSVDSGPAQIDHSLRNGLLIFFLLVVPIIVLAILGLLYIFKRDSLDPCLKGSLLSSLKPRNVQTANPSHHANHSVWDATVQTPPARPETPPATTLPISGFRYGELDYWKTDDDNTVPEVPPNQGPGVPKPIPFKPPQN